MATIEELAERVERLLLRHEELRRTHALLEQQCAAVTVDRDHLRARLVAARNRIDSLLVRLPAQPAEAGSDTTAATNAEIGLPTHVELR